jgi:hypothetical protein
VYSYFLEQSNKTGNCTVVKSIWEGRTRDFSSLITHIFEEAKKEKKNENAFNEILLERFLERVFRHLKLSGVTTRTKRNEYEFKSC